jgi:hypothetical protein
VRQACPLPGVGFSSAVRIQIASGMRAKFTSETARAAGKIGGPARAQALSPLRRSMIGARAGGSGALVSGAIAAQRN